MRTSRFALLALMLLVVLAACGGDASTDTTTPADDGGDTTTTPAAVSTTEGSGEQVSSLADMPEECLDAFRTFLQELEPLVEGRDFNQMTQADMEAFLAEIEPISAPLEEQTADCPDVDLSAEESLAAMREFAEAEAPGTVAYFIWLEEFIGSFGEGSSGVEASGDCETDLATLDEYVAQGGTMSDLPVGELAGVGALITAVSSECSPERFQEWVTDEANAAWMSG